MSSTYMGTYCPSRPSLCATKDVTYLAFLGLRKGKIRQKSPRRRPGRSRVGYQKTEPTVLAGRPATVCTSWRVGRAVTEHSVCAPIPTKPSALRTTKLTCSRGWPIRTDFQEPGEATFGLLRPAIYAPPRGVRPLTPLLEYPSKIVHLPASASGPHKHWRWWQFGPPIGVLARTR